MADQLKDASVDSLVSAPLDDGVPADGLRADLSSKPASQTVDVQSKQGSGARWWLSVAAGLILTAPLAWLLSHAALLPFFLGVFFFVLFGLVIGATVHRFAAPGRPYSSFQVFGGTTLIVLFGWSFSICQEAHDAPKKLAEAASLRTRNIGDRTATEFRSDVEAQIRQFIAGEYPPGGVLGFVQWAAASGVVGRGTITGVRSSLKLPHRRYLWLIRIVGTVAMLAFGVGSQTLLLRKASDPAVRRIDESKASDK